jgi:hypothetical protein
MAVVAGYAAVSVVFVTPPVPAQAAVREAFSPYFAQGWRLFAPDILRVNRALQIQVAWQEDGEFVESEWLDVTHEELASVRGVPAPSRIASSSMTAASEYTSRFYELNDDQQARATDTFIQVEGDGYAQIPDAELIDELDALGDDRAAVIDFLRYDYMLIRFATAYGEAHFGRDVERVRWRVEFDRPNDFLHRFDEERQTELEHLTLGWRHAMFDPTDESIAIFRDVQNRYSGNEVP